MSTTAIVASLRRGRIGRFQARAEELEPRALLSGGATAVAAEVQPIHTLAEPGQRPDITSNTLFAAELYHRLLHRDPNPAEIRAGTAQLNDGESRDQLIAQVLSSPEYFSRHRQASSFVAGLYHDLLGRDPDELGARFWTTKLLRNRLGRSAEARLFTRLPSSFLNAPTGCYGSTITSVNSTGTGGTGIVGNAAIVSIIYNFGSGFADITMSVPTAGCYILNEGNATGGYVVNNTGAAWSGFSFQILSSSTATPTFLASSDQSGQLATVTFNQAKTTATYSNGRVSSGGSQNFLPYTTIQVAATAGGTIVVRETPMFA